MLPILSYMLVISIVVTSLFLSTIPKQPQKKFTLDIQEPHIHYIRNKIRCFFLPFILHVVTLTDINFPKARNWSSLSTFF